MKKNEGFSLVELIIVVAIMAVLIAVLAPQYLNYVEKTKRTMDAMNFAEVVKATEYTIADVTLGVDHDMKIVWDGSEYHFESDYAEEKEALSNAVFANMSGESDNATLLAKSKTFRNKGATVTYLFNDDGYWKKESEPGPFQEYVDY